MPKFLLAMWISAFTLATIVSSYAAGQNVTAQQGTTQSGRMAMGVLAVVANVPGTLFVDGEARSQIVVNSVTTLKLTAGQHFVDLRDAKGVKLWEKIVSVPVGAQVAEKIDSGTTIRNKVDETNSSNLGPEAPGAPVGATPTSVAGGGVGEQLRAFALTGEWSIENRHGTATISVSGIRFLASIDQGMATEGLKCVTPTEHCIWELAGTINGLSIDGVATMPKKRSTINPCESPESWEHFTANIEADWQRIIVNTHVKTWVFNSRDSKKWPWDKPKTECSDVHIDRTDPYVIVLHSNSANRLGSLLHTSPISSAPTLGIASQIDEIVKSGRYTALPPAQETAGGESDGPSISVENRTRYDLTVMMAGPVERSASIPAGSSQSVKVPPGTYRVVGQVKLSSVLPFFGTQTFAASSSYFEVFYIK